ncbi:MAG: hypothetical protein MR218_06630 [Eubacterium sp.]|nr:hypothetical protein [Eubacterium sp.]
MLTEERTYRFSCRWRKNGHGGSHAGGGRTDMAVLMPVAKNGHGGSHAGGGRTDMAVLIPVAEERTYRFIVPSE